MLLAGVLLVDRAGDERQEQRLACRRKGACHLHRQHPGQAIKPVGVFEHQQQRLLLAARAQQRDQERDQAFLPERWVERGREGGIGQSEGQNIVQ